MRRKLLPLSRLPAALLMVILAALPCTGSAQHPDAVSVQYESPIANYDKYPELLYWFFTRKTFDPAQYDSDIQRISQNTPFGFAFLTERDNLTFIDNPAAHTAIAGIVHDAHAHGLKIGQTFFLQAVDAHRTFPLDENQTVISEAEGSLGANGQAHLASSIKMRVVQPRKTEVVRVFAFRKTGEGEYDPATFVDVTAKCASGAQTPGTLSLQVDLGPKYAGYTVFALYETWFTALDLYSDAYIHFVHEAVDQYRDVPLDGTSLDEFGYMKLPWHPDPSFRGHFGGAGFAAKFEQAKHMPFLQTLFETRYAPAGRPEIRIRAIDEYWDFFRQGPLRIEQEFYNYSRTIFGEKTFAGIHSTFHNHLTNDEPWVTGLDWWSIPRQYGMSDEDLSLPLRMGLLVSEPGNLMYDQFYDRNVRRFPEKALNDARFDARLHYHAYDDTGTWGADLSQESSLAAIRPVEKKIRLLNRFEPTASELPLLVVFGVPSLLNWYPHESARNEFDLNASLHIEEKVNALWNAGYRCAVVPSDLIDNGLLTLDKNNRPVLHGHTFRAVVYLAPEFAKPGTLLFFQHYAERGGPLMLDGTATHDFDGNQIGQSFARLAAMARVRSFSIESVAKLGIEKDPLRDMGGSLEDGSIILTDLPSLDTGQPKTFSVTVNGHSFSGSYIGVFALRAASNGRIEKLACGQCSTLARDGREVLHLQAPADLVLLRVHDGSYKAVLDGVPHGNAIALHQ